MLDRTCRRIIDPLLDPIAGVLSAAGVSAVAVTLAGFAAGLCAAAAAACQHWNAAAVLILLNRLCDGLDGMVARKTRITDSGGFLDIVLDIVFYGAVPLGFGLSNPQNMLPAAALLHSFLGTSGSFLAWAAIAAKRGPVNDWGGKKSMEYSAGLMEGSETVLFFLAFCLFPSAFGPLAWTFCGLCWLTTLLRIRVGWKQFAATPSVEREHGQGRVD
ncbi:MAG: CDP-alcohol phosphatidyltransferase family protein [Planctomycetaceae bacterium]